MIDPDNNKHPVKASKSQKQALKEMKDLQQILETLEDAKARLPKNSAEYLVLNGSVTYFTRLLTELQSKVAVSALFLMWINDDLLPALQSAAILLP